MHDQREKAQRDYDWMLSTARQQWLEEGLELGLERGIERGREEGTITGAIQSLQQILGDTVSSTQDLSHQSINELQTQLAELQARVRVRL